MSSSILEATLGVTSHSDEEAILRLLVELGAQFVDADEGSLLVLDESANELVFAFTIGSGDSEAALLGQRVPLGKGITGLAAQTHEVQIGAPTFDTPQATDHSDQERRPHAVLAAPMLVHDRLVGVITAISFDPERLFSGSDGQLFGRIAAVAGLVVDQHRQLQVIGALRSGDETPAALSEEERLDREIVSAAVGLVNQRPEAKAPIARMLRELAAILEA